MFSIQNEKIANQIGPYVGQHLLLFLYGTISYSPLSELENYLKIFRNTKIYFDLKTDGIKELADRCEDDTFVIAYNNCNDKNCLMKLIDIYSICKKTVFVVSDVLTFKRDEEWTYLNGRYLEFFFNNDTFLEWSRKSNSTEYFQYLGDVLEPSNYTKESYKQTLIKLSNLYIGDAPQNLASAFDSILKVIANNLGKDLSVVNLLKETNINRRYIRFFINHLIATRTIIPVFIKDEIHNRITLSKRLYYFTDLKILNFLLGNYQTNKLELPHNVLFLNLKSLFDHVSVVELRNGERAFLCNRRLSYPVLIQDTFLADENLVGYSDNLEESTSLLKGSRKGYDLNIVSYFTHSDVFINNVFISDLYGVLKKYEN